MNVERPVYGPDRVELDDRSRGRWLLDVGICEADVIEAQARLAYAYQAEAEETDDLRREARRLYRATCEIALCHDVRRLALCRARLAAPGEKYVLTPNGRKENAKASDAIQPRSRSRK